MTKQPMFFLFLLLTLLVPSAWTQESILDSYRQNFIRAALPSKTEILKDAALDEKAGGFYGQLCDSALRFALQNAEILQNDADMIRLIRAATEGMKNAVYNAGADTLWQVFSAYPDSLTRTEILGALPVLGKGSSQIAANLAQYLDSQNKLLRSGSRPDYPAVSACIAALAVLGDNSSFPVLFAAALAAYPPAITEAAGRAMERLPGGYRQFLLDVIQKNPPEEKLAAFKAGESNAHFSPAEQGMLAEAAMEQGLAGSPGSADDAALSTLRCEAALAFTRLQWIRASALAVRHFYRTQTGYQTGNVSKERFLEAVACLGAMGSSDAALALALQLGLLNAQTEKDEVYDEDIIFAVVQALGTIGDKSAFDYLLYIGYLSYPENIQAAAKDALGRLKW